MRSNLPVTQTEHQLDAKQPIVTKTDLSGKITYANPAFIKISGFSQAELIGQPHNIVRHPEMPAAAFADMWQTLKADLPWRGLVKNRSKDGGFYWVDAYATPLMQNGQKIGYMSVRSKPQAHEIAAAEQLYRSVNAGHAAFPATRYAAKTPILSRLILLSLLPCMIALLGAYFSSPYIGIVLATLCTLALASWIWAATQQPLQQLTMALQKLGEGDFKFDLSSQAAREFQAVLIAMQSTKVNLRAVMADVVSSAQSAEHETDELKEQTKQVVGRSQHNSDGIASVAAALEELSVSVSEISEATARSAQHANTTMAMVDDGVHRMDQTLATSQQVEKEVREAQSGIAQLARELAAINQMSQTIKEIAEQTNLLALNAAIEAARAGEQGRGFAVVADEVRSLAERTKASTESIEALTKRVLQQSDAAFGTMNQAVAQVAQNNALIGQNHDDLLAIKQSTQGVSASAHDIAGMLDQQKEAASAVATSMERMSAMTEQNNASMLIVNDATEHMADTAKALSLLVKHFEHSL